MFVPGFVHLPMSNCKIAKYSLGYILSVITFSHNVFICERLAGPLFRA